MALSGLISRVTSGLDQREVREVLQGHITTEHGKPVFKYIRIFLSSNLTDSSQERKVLRERVFPHLKSYSRSLGLQFHVIDLYHSLPTTWLNYEATKEDTEGSEMVEGASHVEEREKEVAESEEVEIRDNMAGPLMLRGSEGNAAMCELELRGVLQLALREIRTCQDMSSGPTFMTLLGQKYGHNPLPVNISKEEFSLLCGAMLDTADERQLVKQWYQLDYNAQPPHYILLQPSKDCNEDWVNTQKLLSTTIRRSAKVALGKDPAKVQKYIMSASEEEVTVGVFQMKADPNHCCLWSKRTFTDLLEQKPDDPALSLYCDLIAGKKGLEFDSDALKSLNHLKEARMPAKYIGLDASNIYEFPIKWQRGKGVDPATCPSHQTYLTQMCESVCQCLEQHISRAADIINIQSHDSTYQEVLTHNTYCRKLYQTYMDRPQISGQIHYYLTGSSARPLVVHGPSGYGKTAIMAAAAYRLREENPGIEMTIIIRFLNLTPHSSTIFHTLRNITEQIRAVYDIEETVIPGDYHGLTSYFTRCLHSACEDKPLYIFLDAVDQLSQEDGASGMSWLPLTLPPHVKLVLSTSSEVEYRCFPVLQSLLSKHDGSLIQVPQLTEGECEQMLAHCLSLEHRTLNSEQMTMARTALCQCPIPLFLQLIMRHIKNWKSYSSIQDPLPTSVDDAIMCFFTEMEANHGIMLVSHLLAYVTASKYGLTEPEVLDILALDKEVMSEVKKEFDGESLNALVFLPPVIWSQLNYNLQPVLTYTTGVDHSLVLRWSHRRLREMAEERYLPKQKAQKFYGVLADYFSGTSSCKKDVESSHSGEDKSESFEALYEVNTEPLLLNEHLEYFNIHKLYELPHALSKSGRYAYQALTELLLDYQWLKACIHSLPCQDIIHDFTPVIPTVPIGRTNTDVDHELRLLRRTLMYSTAVLNVDSSQFPTQLAGRLLPYITDSPDSNNLNTQGLDKYPILKKLVQTALEDTIPSLTPLHPLCNIPGGPHLVSMQGHRDTVSCISTALIREGMQDVSVVIVTSSWDKTLKSWDLASTGVLKTFDGHTKRVLSVALTADGQYAASGSDDKTVRYWYVPSAECIHVMKGHSAAVNGVAVMEDGSKTVSASSDATVKIWNTDQNSSSAGQLIYTNREHKKPVLSLVLKGNMLASGTSNGRIFLTDIVSGQQLNKVQGHGASVTALSAETVEGCCYLVSGSSDGSVKVWNLDDNFNLLHSLSTTGGITSISIGLNGRLLVSNGQKEPGVWDLVNGTRLYNLPPQEDGVQSTAMTDSGRLAITGSSSPSLTIWDILSPPVKHVTQLYAEDITSVALSGCGGLGVCTSQSGSVCVFDTTAMTVIQQLQPHSSAITQVLMYKDGNKLLTASSDGTICLWNGETGEILTRFDDEQESAVNCLAIKPTRDLLMTGAENGEVAFWNIDSGKKLRTFTDHSSGILAVAFIKEKKDQFMFSSSRNGSLCIRELNTAKIVVSTQVNTGDLVSTAIAPNATYIACGSKEGSSYIVSLPYGTLSATLSGHTATVNTVKVFPDSIRCVTGSNDCTIRVWSIEEAQCIAVLHVDAPVLACDVNYSSTILYGIEGGWVSTAAFQSDQSKPNILVSQLNPKDSSILIASSSVSSQSVHEKRTESPQNVQESTDQGELLQPSSSDDNLTELEVPKTHRPDETKTEYHEHLNKEESIPGPNGITATTDISTRDIDTTPCDNTSLKTESESITNTTATKSSACVLL